MAEIPDITIEVSHLVKTYGALTAVNDLSFTVKRGEIVGLLGPNGAGKSTTMRILTGYLPANSGSVRICGHPVASEPEATKRHIGYMPENNPLPDEMRVSEYLWFRGRLKEMPRAKLRARIDEVLELCDLKRNRHRILGRLSKGNKQRVGIAEAILAEPAVIIMDEPTIGLDPHQIIIVRDLIASLRGRMSVIISSHILPEIEATCDRVLIINGGRIVAQGSPADLRHEIFGSIQPRATPLAQQRGQRQAGSCFNPTAHWVAAGIALPTNERVATVFQRKTHPTTRDMRLPGGKHHFLSRTTVLTA